MNWIKNLQRVAHPKVIRDIVNNQQHGVLLADKIPLFKEAGLVPERRLHWRSNVYCNSRTILNRPDLTNQSINGASSSSAPSAAAFSSESWSYDFFLSFREEDTRKSSTAAFSSESWSYDVFLSFRGEDTRKTFVDHLYAALVRQGIHTYKDDETLPRGESVDPSLKKAIEESQIAVIIFSENYANSSWCLEELAHILKCQKETGIRPMPIFYGVDPSDVRKQTGKFGDAFREKHKGENQNKVKSWEKALFDASSIAGWDPKNIANGHESKAINEIVDKISLRLQPVTASANEELVGIAARVQRLTSELQLGSGGVRMIGIWGVGGGGKTTLAASVYDEIYRKFDGCCFLANIREESTRRGLEELKKEILSQTGANSIGGGRLISQRLRYRKVLIVLDDVDHLDQLEALAGSPDWFGDGSRVIITTRDMHLLNARKVVAHDVSLLQGDEAIELFRKYAPPRSSIPMEDYEKLSKEVVTYAGGLPLALKVLGSSLCDKNVEQWKSALTRLKKIPENKILDKLRISFDGLTKQQKDLFLDIACFHRGDRKVWAMKKLDVCGFDPVIGVEELRQKALITIKYGKLDMHDMVQEMGHYIVRGEHPNNPEKHSRIWKKEDALRICTIDATTELDNIQAIHADCSFEAEALPPLVANTRNLLYIEWKGDIGSPLLNNFPPTELCCLILYHATQERLWNGYKNLQKLKIMELYELENLITTPNFEGIPNLERLVLYVCPALEEVHSSLGGLVRLVSLYIVGCPGIKNFPSIARLKKLQTLSFTESPGLFELPEMQQKIESLGDEDINPAVVELSKLNRIQHCFLHRNLRMLDLSFCKLGDGEMTSAVWELPNLQELNLSWNKFSRLDFSLIRTPRLKLLDVRGCKELVELSELPSSIAVLKADECYSLKTIGDVSSCKWLWKVSLRGAKKVDGADGDMLVESMLKRKTIEDHHISIGGLPQLPELGIVGRLCKGSTYRMRLPHDWSNDFSGFLIHLVTFHEYPEIIIKMKEEEGDEDSRIELHQESNQPPQPQYDDGRYRYKHVGYVSFNSLWRTACMISTYNVIEISFRHSGAADRIGAGLVPRESKDDPTQTTNVTTHPSQFWDDQHVDYKNTFAILDDSKSSLSISWRPVDY